MELTSLVLSLVCIYAIKFKFSETYEDIYDPIPWYYLAGPCFLIAACIHPTLNMFWLTDTAWAFSMYLEGVAVLPQLKFFKAKNSEIERFTSHFVAFQGISKLFGVIFWLFSFGELNRVYAKSGFNLLPKYSGYVIMLA
jgi:hypothetical protein